MSARAAKAAAADPSYEADKRRAAHPDPAVRGELAASRTARPEFLYLLASDESADVRRAIAANLRTPVQADALLARDPDEDVRADLARKVATVLPGLSAQERERAGALVLQVVSDLARDQAARVRGIVAEALKDAAHVPPDLVAGLARDADAAVAAPVLQFSPLLTDADLLEIIAGAPASGALAAIARRAGLAAAVSDAIVAVDDDAAVAALLANGSAQIREETLDLIVERAPAHASWHEGLVRRPLLPARLAGRIAGFVADALLAMLQQRADLDPSVRRTVAAEVARRVAAGGEPAPEPQGETADERAARELRAGTLDGDAVDSALQAGDRPFARAALAALAAVTPEAAERILGSRSAKGIVALCWRAKLTANLAKQVQLRLGGIAPQSLLQPAPGGGWPLSEAEMEWHLEFFGVPGGRA